MDFHSQCFGQVSRPFVAGFMRGYRGWRMDARGGDVVLRPVSHPREHWIPGRNVAECLNLKYLMAIGWNAQGQVVKCNCCDANCDAGLTRLEELKNHRVPSIDEHPCNQCGFYGLHTPDMEMLNDYMPTWPFGGAHEVHGIVFGSFKATGVIVEGERGFRAQIGEVEALVGLGAAAWAEKYNVPLVLTLEALAERFPPTQLPAMMPKKADITASSRRPIVTASNRRPIVVPNAWMNTPGAWVGWQSGRFDPK